MGAEQIEISGEGMEHACFISILEATKLAIDQAQRNIHFIAIEECENESHFVNDISVETLRNSSGACGRVEAKLQAICLEKE